MPPFDRRPAWVVPCPDLDRAMDRFETAGFSLLAIGPADDPHWALMSSGQERFPATLRLDTTAYDAGHRQPYLEVNENDPLVQSSPREAPFEFIAVGRGPISAADVAPVEAPDPTALNAARPAGWVVGRAGMRYRDLLPDRWGGQFIASHIHVPDGGPVPDYVHYHHVDFQLIFCHRGWVRVVYQDQGEPFVLEPGDAILQAPGLRHRVLEASDDLHVVEVSSPAEHATFVDHELELPNASNPGRWYGGQRYVHHRADDVPWNTGRGGIRVQTLGLEPATGGRFGAAVVHVPAAAARLTLPFAGTVDFEFLAVLDGAMIVTDRADGRHATLQTGSALGLDDRVAWSARAEQPTRLLVVSRHRA